MPEHGRNTDSADPVWGEWVRRGAMQVRAVYEERGRVHLEFKPVPESVRIRTKRRKIDGKPLPGID